MKKVLLERFIKKYHLNGLINEAVWVTANGTLQVKAIADDKKLFGNVTWKDFYGFENTEIGVLDTRVILKCLKAIPAEDVSAEIIKYSSGDVALLSFSGNKVRTEHITGNPSGMNGIPKMKSLPQYNATIMLDDEFIKRFVKTYTATKYRETLFMLRMSEQTGKLGFFLTNSRGIGGEEIYLQPRTIPGKDVVEAPINFSAKCLIEVLKANPEFKDPILNVADAGLASISFSGVDLDTEYHLVKMVREE